MKHILLVLLLILLFPSVGVGGERYKWLDEVSWRKSCKEIFPIIVDVGYYSDPKLDPYVLLAIAYHESRCGDNPGNGPAVGIMQIIPFKTRPSREKLKNKRINIKWGAKILGNCLVRYKNIKTALQCYRGFGYEPKYYLKVLRTAEKFRKEAKEARGG